MGIRKPLTTVGTFTAANERGAGSVAGGVPYTFKIPQDSDNVVVKFTASVAGAGYSALLQTTDDGGTTWYDVSRTSVVSNAINATATWCNGMTNGGGIATAQNGFPTASLLSVGIRNTAASTLAANQVSGLPLLSDMGRVFVMITGNVTSAASNTYTAEVKVNSESGTA